MRRVRIDDHQEVLILTGLIVSDQFIKDVEPILDIRLFRSDHSITIAKWCLNYFKENNKAPGVHIQDIYAHAVDVDEIEDEQSEMVARVLERVSKEYERSDKFNHEYLLNVAQKYFSTHHIQKECNHILDLAESDPLEASRRLENFKGKELPKSQGHSVLKDRKLIRRAFEQREKPLFHMRNGVGEMINEDLRRQCFIGILGTEKSGKTWNLLEFALKASNERCNVAFFQAGDMTDEQQAVRIGINLTGVSDKKRYCREQLYPTYDCIHNQDDSCDLRQRKSKTGLGITDFADLKKNMGEDHFHKRAFYEDAMHGGYKPCSVCRRKSENRDYTGSIWYKIRPRVSPLTWQQAAKAMSDRAKKLKGRDVKLHSSAGDLSIAKIDSILDYWERTENFIADVIITDYADLFVSGINQDFRHQTNQIWKDHRFLSQRRNALVITATQADAEAYGKDKLELKNFSEDKRKYAHVTAFYGINQTYEEKVMGFYRMNHLVVRDDDFDPRREVKVMQCLPMGQPNMGSFF